MSEYTKQFIITPPLEKKAEVYETLAAFSPHKFEHIAYLAVTVRSREQEASLLETLTKLPGVMFREALQRSIEGGEKHD